MLSVNDKEPMYNMYNMNNYLLRFDFIKGRTTKVSTVIYNANMQRAFNQEHTVGIV